MYIDNMTATSTTETHLSSHIRPMVDRIAPAKDVQVLTQAIPRSLASAIPKPVLYWNYSVGECNDLIFGVSLVDYATSRALAEGDIPKILKICIKEVDARGLDSEGIYRVSGRHANVQEVSLVFISCIDSTTLILHSCNTKLSATRKLLNSIH